MGSCSHRGVQQAAGRRWEGLSGVISIVNGQCVSKLQIHQRSLRLGQAYAVKQKQSNGAVQVFTFLIHIDIDI